MYKTDAEFEKDLDWIDGKLAGLKALEGKVSKSADQLLGYFKATEEVYLHIDNAIAFAHMSYDQDTRVQKYSGYKDRADAIASKASEATSWFSPELVTLSESTLEEWYKAKPDLALYRHYISNELRSKKFTLSPQEERILSLSGPALSAIGNANTALREADIEFPSIKGEAGEDIELSEGRVAMLLENPNRDIRRSAALGLLDTYRKYKNSTAALMTGNVMGDIFNARARGYGSALHASMDAENIDTTVYLNLLSTVKGKIEPIRKYVDLRRQALNVDSIHNYDMFAPLDDDTKIEYTYEEAMDVIVKGCAPLGTEYNAIMKKGFDSRWVDVYETAGKRSGAYSWGSYKSHPFQLTNFNGTFDDMFTLGHEFGHSMHTYLATHNQPFIYGDYTIFVAEVASTFNESLIMDYLLKNEKDPKKRLYLVTQYIDQIRGTLITQAMFADFELKMHRAAEADEPLTSEKLCELYTGTLRDFYGPKFAIDEQYGYTWIRIPHFYRNFYVYKYATSYSAAQALSKRVLTGGQKELDDYLGFLKGGSSKYPLDLLKGAGVDMSKPEAVVAVMDKLGELVNEMEKLMVQTGVIKKS
jgi:oligoendopeptidase F